MLPPDSKQSEALVEFIRYFRWDTMALLTDNTDYGRKTVNSLSFSLDPMKKLGFQILNLKLDK